MKKGIRNTTQAGRIVTLALLATAVAAAVLVTWAVGAQGPVLGTDGVAAVVAGLGLMTLWILAGRAAGLVWVLWRGQR